MPDQADTLRKMMSELAITGHLETAKKFVGYYDRLCPYCNGKLPEGERVHPGCREVERQEQRARLDKLE